MKILVVDDDNIIRMGLTKMIERINENYTVVAGFQNGALTLDYLKKNCNDIDLVITDIKMPIMTGIELIQAAVKELDNPPIFIVLSGYDEFTYVRDTMKYGAFNYLLKPIKKDELKAVIEEVEEKIDKKKAEDMIIEKSIEIIKKDFFKNVLFSNKELGKKNDNQLLESLQLDENYKYKLIVVDKKIENSIVTNFIKDLIDTYGGLECSHFVYKDSIFILFYINSMLYDNFDDIIESIVDESGIFTKNNCNVYILGTVEKTYKLREQSKLVLKIKKNSIEKSEPKKYFLNDEDRLNKVLENNIESTNNISSVIKLAREYIINNFNKNISLKTVADEVFLSQNYLSELFRKEMGEGFYDFLSKYRIKKAKEILLTTNLKVYEIAQMVGYNDSITFGRAFKKMTGTTPNNFRNNR
ncbi:MAG: response regulator [Clostridium sp.]